MKYFFQGSLINKNVKITAFIYSFFGINVKVFTVTNQFNASLLNKSVNLFFYYTDFKQNKYDKVYI